MRSLPKHWRQHRSSLSKKEGIKTSCVTPQTRRNKTKSIKVRKSPSDSIAIIIANVIDAN